MKKTILFSALAMMSVSAFAINTGSPCSGAGGETDIAVAGTSTDAYIKQGFKFKCSNNVQLVYGELEGGLTVRSNSKKGANNFKGSTGGGAVSIENACTISASLCTAPATVAVADISS